MPGPALMLFEQLAQFSPACLNVHGSGEAGLPDAERENMSLADAVLFCIYFKGYRLHFIR